MPAHHLLSLGYRWLNKRGRNVLFIGTSEFPQKKLDSGEHRTETLVISAPIKSGKFILEIDIVDNDVWFNAKLDTTKKINVKTSLWFLPLKYIRLIF
jgi:hypothetical protein